MAYISFQPNDYFNTLLYTGNGSSGNAQTGIGFQPDWVWIKDRGQVAGHQIFDSVRGATKRIQSDSTGVEVTNDGVSSFDSDGFTLGANSSCNENSQNFVAWNWKANGSGSSNTDGDITSTVSANTTSGFSIVSYTGNSTAGATIGHGLGVKPSMIITKQRSGDVAEPVVYHTSTGATKFFKLNETGAVITNSTLWNDTEPTSTLFTVGTAAVSNASYPMIAYCFAEKKGFSKFGSYTGNGNADGTFIYTGFKPAMVIYKRSDGIEGWMIQDNRRPGYNPMGGNLFPNVSNAESTDARFDFLSNGFKARSGNQNTNASTHIFMAFAEEPLVSSNGVPATAR